MTEAAALKAPAPTLYAAHNALATIATQIVATDDAAFRELVKQGITPEPVTMELTNKLREALFGYRNASIAAAQSQPKTLIATGIAQVERLTAATEGKDIEAIKGRLMAIFTTLNVLLDHKPE